MRYTNLQLLLSNKWHVVRQLINIRRLIYIKPSFLPSYVLFQQIEGRVSLALKSAWKNGESPHHWCPSFHPTCNIIETNEYIVTEDIEISTWCKKETDEQRKRKMTHYSPHVYLRSATWIVFYLPAICGTIQGKKFKQKINNGKHTNKYKLYNTLFGNWNLD